MTRETGWRQAVVTRAQTIARGLRMIDLALEGRLPTLSPHSSAEIAVPTGDTAATRTFDCIPAPNGQIRVTVGSGNDEGLRFMWSLVEGAVVRMSVAGTRAAGATGLERPQPGAKSSFSIPILAVNDAIILGENGGAATHRAVVANSSVV